MHFKLKHTIGINLGTRGHNGSKLSVFWDDLFQTKFEPVYDKINILTSVP